ncbi:MAG: chemotaxis protein CheW [Terracidiphilus sp.]
MAITSTNTAQELERSSNQLSTFFVADLFFGVDVLQVQEVLKLQPMTPVPQAPEVIEGLINLRGQIVTAIDMRRRLKLPSRPAELSAMNIVVTASDGAVSLLVDEIGDVIHVDASSFEFPPANLNPVAKQIVRGVHKLKDQLLLVLDTERTVDLSLGKSS